MQWTTECQVLLWTVVGSSCVGELRPDLISLDRWTTLLSLGERTVPSDKHGGGNIFRYRNLVDLLKNSAASGALGPYWTFQ